MKKLKRLAAILTTVSMILSMITVVNVNAEGVPKGTPITTEGYSDQRGDFVYKILGTSPSTQDVAANKAEAIKKATYTGTLDDLTKPTVNATDNEIKEITWNKGDLLWIGIDVQHIDRLKNMLNSDFETQVCSEAGLGALTLAVAYDSVYFGNPAVAENGSDQQSKRLLTNSIFDGLRTDLYTFSKEDGSTLTYDGYLNSGLAASTIRHLHLDQADNSKIRIYKVLLNPNETAVIDPESDEILWHDGNKMTANPNTTMFVIPLKMQGDTPPTGKVLEAFFDSSSSTLTVGIDNTSGDENKALTYSFDTNHNESTNINLNNYFNILDTELTKAKFVSAAEVDGIVVTKTNNNLNLSAIPDGRSLTANAATDTDFTVTAHKTDNTTPALADSSVKFYWANTETATVDANGISKTKAPEDMSSYNEIKMNDTSLPWNGGVQKDSMNGKYLYVVADGYIACLGQMTVSDASISGLSGATLAYDWSSAIVGVSTVAFQASRTNPAITSTVQAAYDNGKSKSLDWAAMQDARLKIYRVEPDNSYTEIPYTGSTVKFNAGSNNKNNFVIAVPSSITNSDASKHIKSNTLPYSVTPAQADTYSLVLNTGVSALTLDNNATYPAKVTNLDALRIRVQNTQQGKDELKTLADFGGVTLKIGDTVLDANTKLTPEMSGQTITATKTDTTITSALKLPTVNKKEVTLTATSTLSKVYDGGKATSGTGVTGAITYGISGMETGDSAPTAAQISVAKAEYASADVSENAIAINITGPATVNNADFNKKYTVSTTMPTNATGMITKKPLTGLTFNVTEVQDASYDDTQDFVIGEGTTDKTKDLELTAAMGNLDGNNVKLVMKNGKIAGSAKKNGTQSSGTDVPVNVTGASFELGGTKAGNYSFESANVTVTASVTNLPVVEDLSQATKDEITAAAKNGASNWKAADQKTLADFIDLLPKTDTVNDNKGTPRKVNIAWAVDPAGTTLNEKGGTYTFKATITKDATVTDDILINATASVTITVDASEITAAPDLSSVKGSYTIGDTAENFPTTAKITVDGKEVTVGLTWKSGANTVTAPQVTAESPDGGDVYTVEIDYTSVPNWVTTTNAPATTTKTVTVSAVAKTEVTTDVTVAPVTIKSNDAANIAANAEAADQTKKLAEELATAEKLPATIKFKTAANQEYDVPVTWTTADAYNVKGTEYTYTATLDEGFMNTNNIKVADDFTQITTKVTVDPVRIKLAGTTFGSISINQGTDPTTGIKFMEGGKTTTDKDTDTDCFKITWSPAASALDTSVVGNKQDFTGTITIDAAYPWLSLPLNEDGTEMSSGTLTVTVKKKSSGGGGGGTSAYTVKFSAGKYGKITEGKTSVSIIKGKKVETTSLPTVTPNEGYKFLGWSIDGKTVIDPTADAVSKGVTYTALYEEIVEPTPTPSQTPIIDKKYTKPYASGYDDGMFLPNDYITRAELASMIARLSYGGDIPDSYRASFPDVDDTWYNKYIGYLEDKNVLSGYEDGTFRPNQTVTRGEMCAVIARAQKYDLISVDDMFSDVTDADWAKAYITTLATKNIVSGYEDGTFGTYSPITRAETVAIINRILEPSTAIITFTPLDIAGHWAEADILLAVNEREIKGTVTEPTATPEATPEATAEPEATPEVTPEATTEPTETPAA